MSIPVLLTALLALLSIPPDVHAHGYLSSPRARNWVARQEGREWDHQSLNRKPTSSTCGRSPSSGINYDITPGPRIEATYSCGQTIDLSVTLTAHHKGHFQFKACPISPGQAATQACFDARKLRFISGHGANFDPNYPERAYIPPAPPGTQASNGSGLWNYQYRFQLPAGVSGDLVLLQWHYITANSCLPPGYDRYQFPAGWHPGNLGACQSLPLDGSVGGALPEQFWNCAEVRITNNCQGGPTPTPPTTPTTPTTPTMPTTTTGTLGDWVQCSSNSQCRNGCCSSMYSGGVLKCTPLSGGFNPSICMAGTGPPPAPTPPTPTPPTTGSLGDWVQCSKNSQCRNGCCSGMYSGGVLKCTPLSGGVFNPSICTAV
jgi:hypothetical protein